MAIVERAPLVVVTVTGIAEVPLGMTETLLTEAGTTTGVEVVLPLMTIPLLLLLLDVDEEEETPFEEDEEPFVDRGPLLVGLGLGLLFRSIITDHTTTTQHVIMIVAMEL